MPNIFIPAERLRFGIKMVGKKIGAGFFRTGNSLEFAAASSHAPPTAMNEEPAPASEREPRWTDGIWIFHPTSLFHPIYLRVFARIGATAITGAVTFCVTNVTHFCSLGFKRAEELAPYVVATLAALCVALSRKYRWGLLRVVILVVFYAYAIYGPYVDWVHGPGRSYFPSNDPPDFSFDDVQTELPPKTK